MSKGIIGTKLGMTQVFAGGDELIPVTVIQAGPCKVVQKKTVDTDGYDAIQLGYHEIKAQRADKATIGHFRKAGVAPMRQLIEFRVADVNAYEVGQEVGAAIFKAGDYIDITGTSKGKGFQGVMKRHGFGGGRATHGSMFHRRGGAIGAHEWPGKIFKGQKMPGHDGARRVTVQNLQVVEVDAERNLIMVRGAVPGSKNGSLLIRNAVKA
ncbi:50S ribosomal protein L3 [bacterium]|nr:MAG: 50S ribosomal protein L3 [bacterium]